MPFQDHILSLHDSAPLAVMRLVHDRVVPVLRVQEVAVQRVNGCKGVHDLGYDTTGARIPALIIAVLDQELKELQNVTLVVQQLTRPGEFSIKAIRSMHVHLPRHSQEYLAESTCSRVRSYPRI